MLRWGETKAAKEKFYGAKKLIKIWDVDFIYRVISKWIETKNNSRYLIGYLDKVTRQLVLILTKMSGYVKIFKNKDEDKDKNNKLMSFCTDDEKLLEKSKTIWAKIEDLKNIKLNALPVYADRYIKTKTRTYNDKVY